MDRTEPTKNGIVKDDTSTVSIELGDIIHINASKHKDINDKVFLIEYLDKTQIHLLQNETFEKIIIRLDNGKIENYELDSIQILYRQEHKGYARQNGFVPGVWLTIEFGGDIPTIINGQVIDLEEDMIEIKTYPDNNTIYLDFKYHGIPLEYNILKISIRQQPEILDDKDTLSKSIKGDTSDDFDELQKQSYYSDDDDVIHPLSDVGIEKTKALLKANIDDGNKIFDDLFVEEELDVEIEVLIEDDKRRVDLETQLNDLLEALKSKTPTRNLTNKEQKRIHTIVSRFKQLREQFSVYDSETNRLNPLRRGANYKPLVNKLKNLEEKIEWIYPVVTTKRKLYDIEKRFDDEDDREDYCETQGVELLISEDTIVNDIKTQDEYYRNVATDDLNRYDKYNKNIAKNNEPFVNKNDQSNILKNITPLNSTGTGIETYINNFTKKGEENYSMVNVSNEDDKDTNSKRFVIQKYNLGVKTITKKSRNEIILKDVVVNETIPVHSFISLPKQFIEYGKVRLPETSIYDKVNITNIGWKQWQLINAKKKSPMYLNAEYIDEFNTNETDEVRKNRFKELMSSVKQYIVDPSLEDDEKYEKLLNYFIPRTREIIEVIKDTTSKTNIQDVLKELQPFHIYKDDLSFKQYLEIVDFLQQSIQKLKSKITQTIRTSNTIRKLETQTTYQPIFFTLAVTYADMLNYIIDDQKMVSNNEFLRILQETDNGRIINDILTVINSDLYSDIDIKQTVENALKIIDSNIDGDTETSDTSKISKALDEECENAVLSKMYATKEELARDNGKSKIYVDKEYDTTRYEFGDEYMREKDEMTELEYMDFLAAKLIEVVGMKSKDAIIEARSIIDGKKLVRVGNYAFVPVDGIDEFGKPKTKNFEYYKWDVSNKWVYDAKLTNMIADHITADPSDDINRVFCNVKDKCFLKSDDTCKSLEDTAKDLAKNSYKEMLKTLSSEIEETKDKMKPKLELVVNNTFKKYKELIKFKQFLFTENTIKQYNYGTTLTKYDIVISPYAHIRDLILGDNSDKTKQMTNIMRFHKEFTQPAIVERGDDQHWFYCKDTQTKLLPTFFVDLAMTYVNGEDVSEKLLEIVRERGTQVDNMIVDKHSGYVIRMIDMDTDEGYNEQGYKIVTKDILEHKVKLRDDEEDELIEIIDEEAKVKDDEDDDKPKLTKEEKLIYESQIGITIRNILTSFAIYIGIDVSKYYLYIIQEVRTKIQTILKSKKIYEAMNKKLEEKGKKTIPYEKKKNELIILFTGIYYLFTIQVSIPHLKTKKTFPGCNRDFDGAPMYDGDTGMNYIACIIKKISSSQSPWDSIKKMKETAILQRMKMLYSKYMEGTTDINNKITEKENYIKKVKDDPTALKDMYEHSMNKWYTFQPFLIRHGKEAELIRAREIQTLLKSDLKRALKSGTRRGTEIMDIMYGSMILNSTHIYDEINKIVQKEGAILYTNAGDGYLENACCSTDLSESKDEIYRKEPLQYFIDKSDKLSTYMKNVRTSEKLMREIDSLKQPYKLVEDSDTKLKYPVIAKEVFGEETIYRAFIKYCKFNTGLPIPEHLKTFCTSNKSGFNITDNINEKMEIMKNEGLIYNTKSLESLLKSINKQNIKNPFDNIIEYSRDNKIINNIFSKLHTKLLLVESKTKLLQSKDDEEIYDTPLPLAVFNSHIQKSFFKVFELFDLYTPQTHETKENRENMIKNNDELYDYITNINEIMIYNLKDFITKHSNMKKSELRNIITYIETLDVFPEQTDNNKSMLLSIHYMKHIIYQLTKLLPGSIVNSKHIDKLAPMRWKLSSLHRIDIMNFIDETYKGIEAFYNPDPRDEMKPEQKARLDDSWKIVHRIARVVIRETSVLDTLLDDIPTFLDSSLYNKDIETLSVSELTYRYFGLHQMKIFYKYVILNILCRYMNLADKEDIIIDETPYDGEMKQVKIQETVIELQQKKTNELLCFMLKMFLKQKKHINYNRETVLDSVFKIREREKDTKTRRLKELTDEERKVDNELKKAKLGAWNKGLQKGLYTYVKNDYDEDRQEIMKEAILDIKVGNKLHVTQMNHEIYKMQFLENALMEKEAQDEADDMSGIVDDDDYDDYDGDDDDYRLRYEQTIHE